MSAPADPLLSATQRRIAGFALTLLALLGSAALLILAIIVLGRLVSFFSSVLWPLAVAGVLALILRPVVDALQRRMKIRRVFAVIVLYAVCSLVVLALLLTILPPVIGQLIDFIAYLPSLWQNAQTYLDQHYADWVALAQKQMANPTVRQIADQLSGEARTLVAHALPSLRAAGVGVLGLLAFTTHVAIIPVYLFFFLLARGEKVKDLPEHLPFLRPGVRDDIVFLVREFIGIVEAFFRGQLIIGLIMGGLLALGFTLVGLKFGLVVGLVIGVLNIVPYLGTILGLAIAVPLAFFQPEGGWHLVGLVLLVKVVVQLIEGWVLTPKIMGHQTGLHPVMIIVAVFFWGTAFDGVLGMLLAIPLTAFVVTAWRLVRRKYLTVSAE